MAKKSLIKRKKSKKKKHTYKKKGGYYNKINYDFNKIEKAWKQLFIRTMSKTKKHPNNNNNNNIPKIHTLTYQPHTIHIEHILGVNYKINLSRWKIVLDPHEKTIILYENENENDTFKYNIKYKELMKSHNNKGEYMYKSIAEELHSKILYYAYLQLLENKEKDSKKVIQKYITARNNGPISRPESGYVTETNNNKNT